MALSEIEKLERRYAENPQGLTFAPLAEVHRKNGEVQRALDLLGPGLALHPDYIPASIVLGRCHMDLGDVHAAERAFLHVLGLDGENVIALKALADISERLLKFEDAERWLHALLALDRSNDEAREQLQRVETSRRQAEVGSSAEPDSRQESAVGAERAAPDSEPSSATAEAAPEPAPAFHPPVAEPTVGWVSQSSEISELPTVEDLEPSEPVDSYEEPAGIQFHEPERFDQEVQPLDGLVGRDVPDEMSDEFRVETSEDIVLRSSGGSEFQVPDASLELSSGNSAGERRPFEEDAPLPPVPESHPAAAEPVASAVPESAAVSELLGESESTEEPDLALLEPEPAAAMSEPEVSILEPELSVPEAESSVPEPEPMVTAVEPEPKPAPPPMRAYAASETGGRPVAQFLKDILSARPPAQAAPPAVRQSPGPSGAGAPTRPAADALSLSSVFGEEEAPATPPAVPAAGTGAGVSFDDFFGAPGATPTQRGTRAPDPKSDDLDQFHAWLQNLKR
jgi:tetratricopeptide (TPR) repeat protein